MNARPKERPGPPGTLQGRQAPSALDGEGQREGRRVLNQRRFCAPRPLCRQSSTVAAGSRGSSSERFPGALRNPTKPARRATVVPMESPALRLGAGPRSPGHSRLDTAGAAGLEHPGGPSGLRPQVGRPESAGKSRCLSRGGTPLFQPGSSLAVGDTASRRPSPSAQLQLPEGRAARAGSEAGSAAATLASHPAPSLQPLAASALWTAHGLPGIVVLPPGTLRGGAEAGTPTPGVPCAPADVNGGRGRARPRGSGAQEGGVRREGEGAHTPPPPRRSFPLPRRKLGSLSPCVRHIGL